MERVFNFSAGPATLPVPVLQQAASEMLNYQGSGQSVMEMSHRSPEYEGIIKECEALFREILSIPPNYKVLFMQGGATAQFSMTPINLFKPQGGKADYVISGRWAKLAAEEAARYGAVRVVASSAEQNFNHIPQLDPKTFDPQADYFHICYNNTIFGTRFLTPPDTGSVPLVADMSSCLCSEPVDVSRFGLIYAGAQKNLGPAGVTFVIIREDLLGRGITPKPTVFDYKIFAESGSMHNTPPTYAIYICKLVFAWIKEHIGGLHNMAVLNRAKAKLLYDCLDNSKIFKAHVPGPDRSLTNIPFTSHNPDTDKQFLKLAESKHLINLKGHRAVGGLRASLFNAMPMEGVEALVECLKEFEAQK